MIVHAGLQAGCGVGGKGVGGEGDDRCVARAVFAAGVSAGGRAAGAAMGATPTREHCRRGSVCVPHKVEQLNAGISYVQDVPTEVFRPYVEKGLFKATTDF